MSRDVSFHETIFSFHHPNFLKLLSRSTDHSHPNQTLFPVSSHQYIDISLTTSNLAPKNTHHSSSPEHPSLSISHTSHKEASLEIVPSEIPSSQSIILPSRRFARPKHLPSYLQVYHCSLVSQVPIPQPNSMEKRPESGRQYSLSNWLNYDRLSPIERNTHWPYLPSMSLNLLPRHLSTQIGVKPWISGSSFQQHLDC